MQDELLRLQGGVAHEGYSIADFDTEAWKKVAIRHHKRLT